MKENEKKCCFPVIRRAMIVSSIVQAGLGIISGK